MSKVFFIGIGGAGMSTLALLAKDQGFKVSGSDIKNSSTVSSLKKKGINVFIGHSAKNVQKTKPALIVYSSVIKPSNVEWIESEKLHIPIIPRAKFLAQLIAPYKTIAVAGTHGKTTTTSMIGFILQQAQKPAYVYLGGKDSCLHNKKIKKNSWIVLETDESDKSFLFFTPHIAVVTNIDKDHLSNYNNSFEQLKKSFGQFLQEKRKRKYTIICADDKNLVSVVKKTKVKNLLTYGMKEPADLRMKKLLSREQGTLVEISSSSRKTPWRAELPIWGEKYLLDALGALLAASQAGVSIKKGLNILQNYQLPHRRREIVGKVKDILVMDGHADHPTEIQSTLDSLQVYRPQRRIIVVYEPHRYTRMNMLKDKIGPAFKGADVVISLDICPAFEKPIPGITGKKVFQWIKKHNPQKETYYIKNLADVPAFILPRLQKNDLIITLGPGTIKDLPLKIVRYLKKNY